MNEFDYLAARAGVVWNEEDRYSHGHLATVLTVSSDVFSHPCTCPIGVDHAALVPTENAESPLPDEYEVDAVVPPIPEVVPVEKPGRPITDPDAVWNRGPGHHGKNNKNNDDDEDGNEQ